ncbi:MAG TPA: UbiA family prenyltransferase [Thermoplasmata archaeon]|nr:UbiA family prenyltransferase [Thermoplasmata archaeon]
MTAPRPADRGTAREIGRFLEIQNLGLNLPFALAFLLVAAGGLPSLRVFVLVVVAFVAARNAGHSFNRWVDRELDRANPRTQDRALVTGRFSGRWALGIAAGSSAIVVLCAALLNPLALALSPVALALVLGYSYTKRLGWGTTVFLGLVQSVNPAAAYVAVLGALPYAALLAVVGMLAWGTSFETIHSLGDVASDRALGLPTIPTRFGVPGSVRLIPVLHGAAIACFASYGIAAGLSWPYFLALAAVAVLVAGIDGLVRRRPTEARQPFQLHFALGAAFLVGVAVAVFVPGLLPLP